MLKNIVERMDTLYLLVLITWYILYIIFMGFLYLKYSKPYKVKNVVKYYKSVPENLTPAQLSMLIYHKITPSTLSAMVNDLIKQGIIIREDNILRKSNVEQLLSVSQNSAIELLFDVLGDGQTVDTNKISDFCKNNSSATDFLLVYDIWSNLAFREASSKQFFVQKMDYELVHWFQIIGYVLAILNFVFGFHYIIGYVTIIPAYFILKYFYGTYKRTEKYNQQFYDWIAYGNYLSVISSKEQLGEDVDGALTFSLLLNKESHVEDIINGEQFITKLNESLQKCYRKAFLFGNRKL